MAAFGLTLDDLATEVEIWPEHIAAFNLFNWMATKWQVGPCGPTGLNHLVLYHRMDRMNLDPDAYSQLENDIQIMESAALKKMGERDS